ncbi:FG-GAP repeat protein [Clostridium felsineum]|uniref:FG-GAP-like repeat-containing protein n=1 Tax=Clostridium felsineum TaxID=36839 RepID=UPI00214D5E0C|nr:FG-GAP-like repeat-containing protein [Clostridium felsineum]MCR3758752.1 FG-GAP repeat protein [Clostridium felsineum]
MKKLIKCLLLLFSVVTAVMILNEKSVQASDSFTYPSAYGWWQTDNGYDVNRVTGHMVSGDFNGDGKADVATLYDYGNGAARIHVFTSTGNSFTYTGANGWWNTDNGYDTSKIADVVAGDFNGDGKDDIAVIYNYGGGATRIHVFTSTGDSFTYTGANGWWNTPNGYDAGRITAAVAGDFNGDGKADIATFYDYGNSETRIHVFTSTGDSFTYTGANGWWNTTGYDSNKIKGRVVAGDFNGDGKTDIAAMYDYGNSESRIHVFTSTGDSFTYAGANGWWNTTGYDANKVTGRLVAGDFNGDKKTDIAAFYDYGNSETRLHVFTSTGDSFTYTGANGWWNATGYDANRITGRVVAGDFDNNGAADIATFYDYGGSASRLHVFLSDNAGSSYVTKSQVQTLFSDVTVSDSMVSSLNSTLEKYDITTVPRIRFFLSQCMEESGLGRATIEEGSDSYLNNMYGPGTSAGRDLGNTQPGDGARFRGIGYIQLTGRYNYQSYSDYKSDSNIMIGFSYTINNYNPWELSGFWWKTNGLNELVDSGASVEQVTRKVNGGYNGLSLRKQYYNECCDIIK